jgi:hypothetical protein
MSFQKICFTCLIVLGFGLPVYAQTRSEAVYPEEGNSRPARRSSDRLDSRPSHPTKYRYKQAGYEGAPSEQVTESPSADLEPISQDAEESPLVMSNSGDMQYHRYLGEETGSSCNSCDDCCECGGEYCEESTHVLFGSLVNWGHRNLAVFGGVHGFKGPRDRGLNGNFGFQEGLNYGAPLGDPWGCGFQLGFQALQSNISGNQVTGAPSADRHQYFATAGIFRRAEVGKVQWAVAFDFLHDTYSEAANLKQIRSETGWLFNEATEIGYSGAYGVGGDSTTINTQQGTRIGNLNPTDQFVCYLRRYFENGGDGRLFGGVTGKGDALVGGDVWIPLSGSWALQNSFTYLIPKDGRGTATDGSGVVVDGGQVRETWGVALNLVWYPGRSARCVGESCYRPVLNVADNSQFLVNQNVSP